MKSKEELQQLRDKETEKFVFSSAAGNCCHCLADCRINFYAGFDAAVSIMQTEIDELKNAQTTAYLLGYEKGKDELKEENERLKNIINNRIDELHAEWRTLESDALAALKADAEKLVEVLETIRDLSKVPDDKCEHQSKAREALKQWNERRK